MNRIKNIGLTLFIIGGTGVAAGDENGVNIRISGYLAQAGKAAQEFDSPAGHNWQYCREN